MQEQTPHHTAWQQRMQRSYTDTAVSLSEEHRGRVKEKENEQSHKYIHIYILLKSF